MSKEDPTGKEPNGAPADDEGYAPGRDPLVQGGGTCAVNCGGSGGGHSAGSAGGVARTQQKSMQLAQAAMGLCALGPGGCAAGAAITAGQLLTGAAVIGGVAGGAIVVQHEMDNAQGTGDGAQAPAASGSDKGATPVYIDPNKHPEAAAHAQDAQAGGAPDTLTIDRAGASGRRAEALKGTSPQAGADRDEYPPAVTQEGGRGSSVRPISPSDNRGAGGSFGQQIKTLPDGSQIQVIVGSPPSSQ